MGEQNCLISNMLASESLLLLIGGSIQLSLGILGQYLAKTYLETKHRPIYIVAETEAGADTAVLPRREV